MKDEFITLKVTTKINLETAIKFINFIDQKRQDESEDKITNRTRDFEKLLKEGVSAFLENEGIKTLRISIDSITTEELIEFKQKKLT